MCRPTASADLFEGVENLGIATRGLLVKRRLSEPPSLGHVHSLLLLTAIRPAIAELVRVPGLAFDEVTSRVILRSSTADRRRGEFVLREPSLRREVDQNEDQSGLVKRRQVVCPPQYAGAVAAATAPAVATAAAPATPAPYPYAARQKTARSAIGLTCRIRSSPLSWWQVARVASTAEATMA